LARCSLFYDSLPADPNAVATDEGNKDTVAVPELIEATSIINETATQQPSYQITVPVLVVVGEDDNLFCTGVTKCNCASLESVRSFESQYYSPQAHVKVVVIPDTGHALALSTTAPVTDAVDRLVPFSGCPVRERTPTPRLAGGEQPPCTRLPLASVGRGEPEMGANVFSRPRTQSGRIRVTGHDADRMTIQASQLTLRYLCGV
jgi:hypothetical protein